MPTYYTYVTPACERDAIKHGVTEAIERLAKKLEQDQGTHILNDFPGPYLTKKLGRQGRLVIEKHAFDDDVVLCFARYLIRGGNEYDAFYNDPISFHQRTAAEKDALYDYLQSRKVRPIPRKAGPTDREFPYLDALAGEHYTEDGTVLESYDWFERATDEANRSLLARYFELVQALVIDPPSQSERVRYHSERPDVGVLFRYYSDYQKLFLAAPLRTSDDQDEARLVEKYEALLRAESVSETDLLKQSRRAYPSIIALDESTWIGVQSSVEANLALSYEEEAILESIMRPSTDSAARYPLFINGRPGSGKSTVLQYLFSEHLAHHLALPADQRMPHPPLYLTYSDSLLDQAKTAAEDILTCGAAMATRNSLSMLDSAEIKEVLTQSFQNFRSFLLSLLSNERRSLFSPVTHVDFGRFSKLWEQRRKRLPDASARQITPELGWHAIRTYIQGMRTDPSDDVDPDVYSKEMPRDLRSLTDETFRIIYDHVWLKWYLPLREQNKFWDDQDLAREVLKADLELARYPALFCDEAQDFTHLELELIQRLCIFSVREVPPYLLRNVPYAFAGDPFQTLNPTGFNWSATQASFHNNITQQLDAAGEAKLQFNFQELTYNYRSSESIVKLCNLVQLVRGVILAVPGLKPQQTWPSRLAVSPVWFRQEDVGSLAAIREQEELVIVVPCQENGEKEYVQRDEFLRSIAPNATERNILSPARAKGLEFDRVLLYGFGDYAAATFPGLMHCISRAVQPEMDAETRLPWEYFFNQLYVAVSRARKRLFIMESCAGKAFWEFAEGQGPRRFLKAYASSDLWSTEAIGGMAPGDERSWADDRDDPLELAKRWEQQGQAQQDSHLMRLARSNYERAGYPERAQLCEAFSFEFDQDYATAGERFELLRRPDDACRCFWSAKEFERVLTLARDFPELSGEVMVSASAFLGSDSPSVADVADVLQRISGVSRLDASRVRGTFVAWEFLFQRIIETIEELAEAAEARPAFSGELVENLLDKLRLVGFSTQQFPGIASLWFHSGKPRKAIEHWEMAGLPSKKEPEWLIRARAETEEFPASLVYLNRLNDNQGIVSAWRKAGQPISIGPHATVVLSAATAIADWDAVKELVVAGCALSVVVESLAAMSGEHLAELMGVIPLALLQGFEAENRWDALVRFAETQDVAERPLAEIIESAGVKWDSEQLIALAVRVLGSSEALSEATGKDQKIVSEFLRRHLVVLRADSKDRIGVLRKLHQHVRLVEAGAAFERAYRLTFALEYYEQWFPEKSFGNSNLKGTDADLAFARRRWIVCKNRLASSGKRAGQHKEEIGHWETRWGVSWSSEPEYPALPLMEKRADVPYTVLTGQLVAIKSARRAAQSQVDATVSARVDGQLYEVKLLPRKQRLIITRIETADQISVSGSVVSSDDVAVDMRSDRSEGLTRWFIAGWPFAVELECVESFLIVRLIASEEPEAVLLGFELPGSSA